MSKSAVKKAKTRKLPIGVSDFKNIISENYYYIDKSLFIRDVIDRGDTIILLPRPRRFGKTLNLSMLKYFYDCCPDLDITTIKTGQDIQTDDKAGLKIFDNLSIKNAGQKYQEKMGNHPVIYLTFKDVKQLDWESCIEKIKRLLQNEYAKHIYLLKWNGLQVHEKKYFKKILDLKGEREDYGNSLGNLLIFLNRYYGKRPVILIDEYDAPIHMGFNRGYYDEIINFMRNFLSAGLKDTDQYLEKAVITGIMRIAKESIFSGLNNPGVYTLLSAEFDEYFGFTEKEVERILEDFDLPGSYSDVQQWYNGYRFGKEVIYNPWSIINYLASEENEIKPYWLNTADNEIVEKLLSMEGKELKTELETLVRGETIEKPIKDNIILKDLDKWDNLLWSFLLMSGYLKYTNKRMNPSTGKIYYTLAIPNMEVKIIYIEIIEHFFSRKVGESEQQAMLSALVQGDIELFENLLRSIVLAVFSYHDFARESEKVYQALVIGLLVWLTDTHEVKSNRESGYGRYDIMIIPRDTAQLGYIIEFKAIDQYKKETVAQALDRALAQIEEKQYETELISRGIKNIKKLAIVFNGKEVHVKEMV